MKDCLWTLAFDHRNSLRRSFFGITGEATEADHQRAREAKGIIFDGVVAAIEQGIPTGQPAVLVDEEYGADVIARARELGIPTAVPVEASGHEVLRFEHGDDGFGPALERIDPTYAKVLVRYNPDGDPDDNRVQRERLTLLQRWVSDHGRQWMLELLVPPTPAQTNQCGGDSDVYDCEPAPRVDRSRLRRARRSRADARPVEARGDGDVAGVRSDRRRVPRRRGSQRLPRARTRRRRGCRRSVAVARRSGARIRGVRRRSHVVVEPAAGRDGGGVHGSRRGGADRVRTTGA